MTVQVWVDCPCRRCRGSFGVNVTVKREFAWSCAVAVTATKILSYAARRILVEL